MGDKISFKFDAFQTFISCDLESLKAEISQSRNVLNKLRKKPLKTIRDADHYNGTCDRLTVLELIVQLRSGEIDKKSFDLKVEIDSKHLYE